MKDWKLEFWLSVPGVEPRTSCTVMHEWTCTHAARKLAVSPTELARQTSGYFPFGRTTLTLFPLASWTSKNIGVTVVISLLSCVLAEVNAFQVYVPPFWFFHFRLPLANPLVIPLTRPSTKMGSSCWNCVSLLYSSWNIPGVFFTPLPISRYTHFKFTCRHLH